MKKKTTNKNVANLARGQGNEIIEPNLLICSFSFSGAGSKHLSAPCLLFIIFTGAVSQIPFCNALQQMKYPNVTAFSFYYSSSNSWDISFCPTSTLRIPFCFLRIR